MSSTIIVAAFDFGTTYSGYAYSFRERPEKIYTNSPWSDGYGKLMSLKTPTGVLLQPDGICHSFGFEAENKYATLTQEDCHHEWRFFRRFKMVLHSAKDLSRNTMINDIEGRPMAALPVFSMSINWLWKQFLRELDNATTGIVETDIKYVITVPAIWDDRAKQFMREAAEQAGLDSERISFVYEPEAASVWCQSETTETNLALAGLGSRYMVIDLGGGTADISVHEKLPNGRLKEIHKASGGPWGGISVDKNYLQMLEHVFGCSEIENLKSQYMEDYFDLLRDFEIKKRHFPQSSSEMVTLRVPFVLQQLSNDKKSVDLGFGNTVSIRKDKIRVPANVFRDWFNGPIKSLQSHLKGLFAAQNISDVRSILLVGGFAGCNFVQESLRKTFPDKQIIAPADASMAVLKGAVMFGHDPLLVEKRLSRFTYGIKWTAKSNGKGTENDSRDTISTKAFGVFVRAGEEIKAGHEVTRRLKANDKKDGTTIPVYRTLNENPVLTTEPGCEKVGLIYIPHPDRDRQEKEKMKVTFVFGDTELRVKVMVRSTRAETTMTMRLE